MKNSNNNADRKFEKQVNHLSSFVGMPLWNGRNPTLSEIRENDRRLLAKQSLSFETRKSLLNRLSHSISSIFTKAVNLINSKDKAVVAIDAKNLSKNSAAFKVLNRNVNSNNSKIKKTEITTIGTGSECCG